jgi:HlyD family secretion protein
VLRRIVIAIAILLMAGGGVSAYWLWLRQEPLPDGLIQANGRIEGDHVAVASEYPGRIVELLVREGDSVSIGQTMVRLDDEETRANVEQAQKAVQAMDARVEAETTSLALLQEEVPLGISTAEAELERAQEQAESARSEAEQAERDAKRYRDLAEEKAVSQENLEKIRLRQKIARDNVEIAAAAVRKAEKKLAEAKLRRKEIDAGEDGLRAIKAQRQEAEAQRKEVESILEDLTILAPITGRVTERLVEVGEVVTAGMPLFDLVDLDHLYLKTYVPEDQIGKVRLDQKARVYVDAYPDTPFPATVGYIASDAEFTPKEVQTPEQRVKLVFAVKLYLDENPDHRLTPGMPADAVIRWKEGASWAKPRW